VGNVILNVHHIAGHNVLRNVIVFVFAMDLYALLIGINTY